LLFIGGGLIMEDKEYNYLVFQYERGVEAISRWIDSRYKMLQFVGYFNAGILTFGFSQKVLMNPNTLIPGISVCLLSILVAFMGFSTEISNRRYNLRYFELLREIESKLNNTHKRSTLNQIGLYTFGSRVSQAKILNPDSVHKLFYFCLMLFWTVLLILHIKTL
jgi:hypothetical protein